MNRRLQPAVHGAVPRLSRGGIRFCCSGQLDFLAEMGAYFFEGTSLVVVNDTKRETTLFGGVPHNKTNPSSPCFLTCVEKKHKHTVLLTTVL